MTNHIIVVAGNIGAGKTSLTERVGERLGWESAFESVADNPYLADFYDDMRSWSFHLQIFFLGHRAEQYLKLAGGERSAILDRSIYEDGHIFARALHHMGNMTERDYEAYQALYHLTIEKLPRPSLLLYLKASVPTLLERIRGRGREIEAGISADYLDLLNSFYDDWMANFNQCPVLTIPADRLDFVADGGHLDIIVEKINEKLSGKEEVVFS